MLNRTLVAFSLMIILAGLSSCSMYPENPLLTFGSKEDRVVNAWKVSYATDEDGTVITEDYGNTKYTFGETGDAELQSELIGATFTGSGTWELADEAASLNIDIQYTLLGFTFDLPLRYNILKLTEDELRLQDQTDSDIVIYLEPF